MSCINNHTAQPHQSHVKCWQENVKIRECVLKIPNSEICFRTVITFPRNHKLSLSKSGVNFHLISVRNFAAGHEHQGGKSSERRKLFFRGCVHRVAMTAAHRVICQLLHSTVGQEGRPDDRQLMYQTLPTTHIISKSCRALQVLHETSCCIYTRLISATDVFLSIENVSSVSFDPDGLSSP